MNRSQGALPYSGIPHLPASVANELTEVAWSAREPRLVRTKLPFTGRWNAKPLWKRALMQRGTCVIGRLVAK